VPVSAIQKIFDSHGIFIPKENRACPVHIGDEIFVEEAVNAIMQKSIDVQLDQETTLDYMRLLRERGESTVLPAKHMTFDESQGLLDQYY